MSIATVTAAEIEQVAKLTAYDPADIAIPLAQTKHRFDIIAKWNIPKGARVLELGCGQGDCTAALAHAVGPLGHVTAIDPGPIDTYGSPRTLAQAQAHLSSGILGSRITWIEADPITFLKSHQVKYDFAVLAHCIWYFGSPTIISDTLRALASHAARIVIAEWSLTASSLDASPHILAVFAQASLYIRRPTSTPNVRTILSPSAIKDAAAQCGMTCTLDHSITPDPDLQDGRWEVADVTSARFLTRIQEFVDSEQEKSVIYAFRDAMLSGVQAVKAGGGRVRSMDVWVGVLTPDLNTV